MTSAISPRRQPGRPAQISRDRIVEAASSVGNLDSVTMRELAGVLNVSHSALYRWIKNRDELFDLISETLVDRILDGEDQFGPDWRVRLAHIAWRMHDEFLALPGYATRLSRPHAHTAHTTERLRRAISTAFLDAGTGPDLAEQSYHIFTTSIVSWLAFRENPLPLGSAAPRFDLFLSALLRGLPAREPGIAHPDRTETTEPIGTGPPNELRPSGTS